MAIGSSLTQPILTNAPQWPNRTCNAPTRPYRVGKKPSMKADLAIYSHTVDAAGQCMSELLMLGHNLDFSTCDILIVYTDITEKTVTEWFYFQYPTNHQFSSYTYYIRLFCFFIDNRYNLPKVVYFTDQLQKFVYSKKDISQIPSSKNLPELVHRFVEDTA